MSLLVIGTLAYDTVETVHARRAEILGGSATYFSLGAAKFGAVRMVSVVGRDFMQADLDLLAQRNIDVAGVEWADGRTFRWSGRYAADWNRRTTLETQLNVLEGFDPTGAGDSFAGGFMGYVAASGNVEPKTLRKAMLYGTIMASYCVQGFSVEALLDRTRGEIDERYDELLSIVTV